MIYRELEMEILPGTHIDSARAEMRRIAELTGYSVRAEWYGINPSAGHLQTTPDGREMHFPFAAPGKPKKQSRRARGITK